MESTLDEPKYGYFDNIKRILRMEAERAEKIGKMTDRQLEIIYKNDLFRLLVPRIYGGRELDLPTFAKMMEELATIDGSVAWNVNLGAGANMFAGYMDRLGAQRIFSNPKVCIAGSGACTGTAIKENDRYMIKGSWAYASGSAHATHFSLNAQVINGNGIHTGCLSFIVPANDVHVHANWSPIGLRATASHNFSVEGASVPTIFAFDLEHPSSECSGALYRFPFSVLAEVNILVVVTGLAIRFLELVKEIATSKYISFAGSAGKALTNDSGFIAHLETLENNFIIDRHAVLDHLQRVWKQVEEGREEQIGDSYRFTEKILKAAQSSRRLVDGLYPYMGMHVIFENSILNRVWREFKVASQHALLSPVRSKFGNLI